MKKVMRSRLTRVILGLIATAAVTVAVLFSIDGTSSRQSGPRHDQEEAQSSTSDPESGRWRRARAPSLSEEQRRAIRRLESLGYLAGSQLAPAQDGVTIYDDSKACGGLNFVVSGHAPEALLMSMSGETLHRWDCDIHRSWPDFKADEETARFNHHTYWRRAHLLPNGDVLAIFERIGLIKLDRHSRVVWAVRNKAHHDLDVDENGNIYVLTGEAHINSKYNSEQPIWEDYISVLDSQGRELRRVSILEALLNSEFVTLLDRAEPEGDILHTNTVELIQELPDTKATPFRKGTVLTAIRQLDLTCAIDLEKETVYWAEPDLCCRQHQPTLLDNGNVLVLDNIRTLVSSAVIEFEPISTQVEWSYLGGVDGVFCTGMCGSCQRLPNGNTLITESDRGRAFEVTPEKVTVWEYVNPHRAGQEDQLIATLFDVVRLREDFPVGWLE